MLKLPKVKAVFDRKKKASAITAGVVEIEIVFNRTQRKVLSTGIELYSNQWEDGLVVRHAESRKLNKQITDLIKKYESISRTIIQEGDEVTYQTFSAALNKKSGKYGTDFIDFCYDVMDRRGLRVCRGKALSGLPTFPASARRGSSRRAGKEFRFLRRTSLLFANTVCQY